MKQTEINQNGSFANVTVKVLPCGDVEIYQSAKNIGDNLVVIKPKYVREFALAICPDLNQHQASTGPRFKIPTDQQLVDIGVIFNDGKLEAGKLTDMLAMAQFIIDRLYEHGDVTQKSSKED